MVIKSKLIKSVIDVIPIEERMMTITLRGTVMLSIINVYMFTAERSEKIEQKDIRSSKKNMIKEVRGDQYR